jgi:hypothetical protein
MLGTRLRTCNLQTDVSRHLQVPKVIHKFKTLSESFYKPSFDKPKLQCHFHSNETAIRSVLKE